MPARRLAIMPRPLRVVLPGVAVHVIQRGHDRAACFRSDRDYFLYLLHLREQARGLGCQVHAYCLMTNHVHLLLTPPSAPACTDLMRNLGQRYTQHFNRTYARTGTLWGNFPQTYSMAGLILTAMRLSRSWEDRYWRG